MSLAHPSTASTESPFQYSTWQLTDSDSTEVLTFLWDMMEPESESVVENTASIPVIKNTWFCHHQEKLTILLCPMEYMKCW
jgi:hypothetical protein